MRCIFQLDSFSNAMDKAEGTVNYAKKRRKRAGSVDDSFTYRVGYTRCECGSTENCTALQTTVPRFLNPNWNASTKQFQNNSELWNETMCYCFFDTVNKLAWPCYNVVNWHGTICSKCSQGGICQENPKLLDENDDMDHLKDEFLKDVQNVGRMPCLCQVGLSSYCTAFPEGSQPLNLWELFEEEIFEEAQGFQVRLRDVGCLS